MKNIDCLIIGHNQVAFEEYEKTLREMGSHSGAYRDFSNNILKYNNTCHSASDIFNLFCCNNQDIQGSIQPLQRVEFFNAAIAYLGTYLHKRGFSFDFIHSFQDQEEELAKQLQDNNILTIAITTTLYITLFPILEIVDFIKKYNQTAKIIIGGPFISTKARNLNPGELDYLFKMGKADFYVNSSQGETTLVNIIYSLKHQLPLDRVHNIYYKMGNRYLQTMVQPENNILAENMVNWDLFGSRVGGFVNVRTCISCSFACAFCGFPQHAGKYQAVPPEQVEQEFNRLNKIAAVESIYLTDDTVNVPVKRFKEILRMIIKNKYTFKWNANFRCQFADRETVELMKESGCETVLLGIESGNDQILRNMNKYADTDKFRKGIDLLKEYGIITMGNFIVGFPGETHDTVKDTITFINESGLDFYRTQLWYYEPITPIYHQRKKYDLHGDAFEWHHSTMDSQTACNWVDETILSIDNSVRYPQYYFDFDSITQLLHKGLSLDQVKDFLIAFNNGIKEKLKDNSREELSIEIIEQIKSSCTRYSIPGKENNEMSPGSEVCFNF